MDPMEYIWEKVSEIDAQGERCIVHRDRNDLLYLYETGFVDTKIHALASWVGAFEDSRRQDGSYRLNRDQWFAKKKFRFDPKVPRTAAVSDHGKTESSHRRLQDLIQKTPSNLHADAPATSGEEIPLKKARGARPFAFFI